MKNKSVFITGIAGFLGSHLADALIAEGYRVSGCDNLTGGYLENVPDAVDFYEYDTSNYKLMQQVTRDAQVVFHAAAAAYEGLSFFSPAHITNNVYGNTISLLSACIDNNVKRFIFCSSMARYGKNEVPYREDMEPKPQDPYGIAKYCAELAIENLCRLHKMEYVISVPHNIIGTRQKYDDPYRNVASIMINRILQGKQPIIYGNGEQKRCFSFIKDVVPSMVKLIFQENVAGEIINIGPDEEFVSINELAIYIAEILDFQLDPIFVNGRPEEIKYAHCSADKSRKMLGYKTQHSLKESLKEMIDWIKTKGAKPFDYHIPLEIVNDKTPETWKQKLI